jgi:RND family efflux transporter MFP subunit
MECACRYLAPKRLTLRLLLGMTLALLPVFAAGCGKSEPPSAAPTKQPAAKPKVTLASPRRATIRYSLSRPGYIEAFEQTPLYAKVAGYARTVKVDIGSKLNEGDVLAELWVPELVVELEQKKALVKQTVAKLESVRAKVESARAGVLRAKADVKRWALELRRQRKLRKQGTIDQQSVDVVDAQLGASRAAQAEAEAVVVKAEADVKEAKTQVRVAEANRDYTATLLRYTKVRAPYTGVVIERKVNTGDFIQPVAGGRKGEALFVVARTDRGVRIFLDVPEAAATAIDRQTRATIRVRARPGLAVKGRVTRSAYVLDPKARTLRTEIDVQKPGKLVPGMYAHVTLTTVRRRVWTLAGSAVVTKGGEAYCFRVVKGRAVKTPVQTGLGDGKRVEVFQILLRPAAGSEGRWAAVTGKERVVATNADKLKDGQEIAVVGPEQ